MEKIVTDTYSFERLREGGFVYVDKTALLLPLVDGSIGKQFFIARPRRFGKSLTISTLQCLFEGRRELFQGLAIEPKWDWSKTWPVLRLDMGSCHATSAAELNGKILAMLQREARRLGVEVKNDNPTIAFIHMIIDLAARSPDGKMVLLVDEYDKPLLGHLVKSDANEIRDALVAFYSVIKTYEGLQQFALVTGVTKFSMASSFSGLNNLNEFSMDARVATLFGYTYDEVKANFPESLKALGEKTGMDADATFDRLVRWYAGYRFEEESVPVFNPVSLGKCLSACEFSEYWFETGTPTCLIDLLKATPNAIAGVSDDGVDVSQSLFLPYEPEDPDLTAILYQTGYLTIKKSWLDGFVRMYHLSVPNLEVSRAFGVCRRITSRVAGGDFLAD